MQYKDSLKVGVQRTSMIAQILAEQGRHGVTRVSYNQLKHSAGKWDKRSYETTNHQCNVDEKCESKEWSAPCLLPQRLPNKRNKSSDHCRAVATDRLPTGRRAAVAVPCQPRSILPCTWGIHEHVPARHETAATSRAVARRPRATSVAKS